MVESAFFQTIVYTFAIFGAAIFLGEILHLLFFAPKLSDGKVTLVIRPESDDEDIGFDLYQARFIRKNHFPNLDIELNGRATEDRLEQIKDFGFKICESEDGRYTGNT